VTGTVLVADDHPLFRQALRLAVEKILPEAAIAEAGTLAAAVAAATAAPDLRLILLDLKMPGATGYSGIALLHAECPDVPILVVSSAEGAAAADEARAFGAIGFLHKGSDLGAIEAAVAAAIGRRLGLPVEARPREHFGGFAMMVAASMAATSEATRSRLGWEPSGPGLIAELDRADYYAA